MDRHDKLLRGIGGLPGDFLSLDCETNGLDVEALAVLPVQVGYARVHNGRVIASDGFIINWMPWLHDRWLRDEFCARCLQTEASMASRGATCQVTLERIRAEGLHPKDVWPAFYHPLTVAFARGLPIAGHNIFAFDCPLLVKTARQFGQTLEFDRSRLLDTALFEKAILGDLELPDPAKGHLGYWYPYARSRPVRGGYSLAACIRRYNLPVDLSGLHAADADCRAVCHLLAAMQAAATAAPTLVGATC
jgi:DNA polymerase III epsilon subunit-like protein